MSHPQPHSHSHRFCPTAGRPYSGSFTARCLLLLVLLICLPSADAMARKKDKRKNANGTPELVEPDAMAAKAAKERRAVTPEAAHTHKAGFINTKYREGIDVSHYQGFIDWQRVVKSANISYAYLKATEGATYVDDTYERNLREAREAGLSVGSYHFYRPNVAPQVQFENIKANIKIEEQDLVPIIDIETRGTVSDAQFIADLKELIRLVERHFGKKPLLYTYQNFYNRHLCGQFKSYHWMMAKYQDEQPILSDGRDYIMWQYTAKGSIDGIRGHVDRSRIMPGFKLKQVGM